MGTVTKKIIAGVVSVSLIAGATPATAAKQYPSLPEAQQQSSSEVDKNLGYTTASKNESSELRNFSSEIGDEKTATWFKGLPEWTQRFLMTLAVSAAVQAVLLALLGPIRNWVYQTFNV
ncbi:MAG: hypothetical protein MR654_08080 [Corynebacterium glucuronolyticum]|nr:hypothetical protein [Corynebacterium glucuronolyticum]